MALTVKMGAPVSGALKADRALWIVDGELHDEEPDGAGTLLASHPGKVIPKALVMMHKLSADADGKVCLAADMPEPDADDDSADGEGSEPEPKSDEPEGDKESAPAKDKSATPKRRKRKGKA